MMERPQGMGPRAWKIYLYCHYGAMTQKAVSEMFGMSPETVAFIRARGRRMQWQQWKQEGIDLRSIADRLVAAENKSPYLRRDYHPFAMEVERERHGEA
jgi:hypothetical protein